MQSLTIIRPDDWHLHLRDGLHMQSVVNASARQFARAIIMPNLTPPITTCEQALAYRQRIVDKIDPEFEFDPLMTLYLTDNIKPQELEKASQSAHIHAAKLYPAGATTNSDAGVTDIRKIWPVLNIMQKVDIPLLVHGEATSPEVDIFDREKIFIDHTLSEIRQNFPELRIVFEHITTADAVDYVTEQDEFLAATITPHHLLINRNAIFRGGINPHHYCLPIAKRETHRQALLKAATGPSKKFFSGTDSAPHTQSAKQSACGCAGIFSAHAAIECYATAFEQTGNFTEFESFMSFAGPDFYKLPRNTESITITRTEWQVPDSAPFGEENLVPFMSGQTLNWKLDA